MMGFSRVLAVQESADTKCVLLLDVHAVYTHAAKESISAEWANSFGAWYVHAVAMASLRSTYPMLCVEHGVHAYEIAEQLLKYFDQEIKRSGHGQCKSRLAEGWFKQLSF